MYKNRVENDRKIDTSSFYLGNSAKKQKKNLNFEFFCRSFPHSAHIKRTGIPKVILFLNIYCRFDLGNSNSYWKEEE